jgi:hypothetical protein
MTWNQEIKIILDKIRMNSIKLSNNHRETALAYQRVSRFFDLPIICISVVSSSLGSNTLIEATAKDTINMFLSMVITILTSIKLYMNITSNLNQEIQLSRDYYVLSIDIYKNLNLSNDNRPDPKTYLNECYSQYVKLIEQSTLNNKIKKDELLKIDMNDDDCDTLSSSSSSSTPTRLSIRTIPRNILITESEEI